jgi:D-3-phosphoglycerate dehydrogenase / 2-oxoglutarate reductase
MRVLAFDPFVSTETAAKLGVEIATLDEIYANADFVTVHTPLTKETRGLIGAEAFAKMKKGVRIINCARGGIVDETALAEAIKGGKVAGAALDVFVEEPPPDDHPLLKLNQVVATPHLGAATDEAQINVAIAIADQVGNFLSNGVIQNAVNFPALTAKQLVILQPYLTIGEKLGSFLAQVDPNAPQEVQIEYSGDIVEYDVAAATAAVLRGVLSQVLESPVNYVNAPLIARERGIRVLESRSNRPSDFLNSVIVKITTEKSTNAVEGAVFSNKAVRLVRLNAFHLEAVPEGYILVVHNHDVPGVVGAMGTLLGQHGINIASLELGREKTGGKAVALIHVDGQVPATVLTELQALEPIISAQQIRL